MEIDLDITPGKWELSDCPDRIISTIDGKRYQTVLGGDQDGVSFFGEENKIATLCVPEFKAVSDAVDELSVYENASGVLSPEAVIAKDKVKSKMQELKARIKELKDAK